jgi:hypothetical protein
MVVEYQVLEEHISSIFKEMMTVHSAETAVTNYHTAQLRKPTILAVIETESKVSST